MKTYTDILQSKKLAEILPIESADMWYGNEDHYKITIGKWKDNEHDEDDVPCWSLAALLGVLPRIEGLKLVLDLEINYVQYPSDIDLSATADNPIDACVNMIVKLHEQKIL